MFATRGWGEPLFPYSGGNAPKPGAKPPLIANTFAVDKGRYGHIWKIYVEADDPDGDMQRIACMVEQLGYGHYLTDWIYLKPGNEKHFRGYLQWNTLGSGASYMPEWTQITLKVSVIDRAGNESNIVVFPFTFETGVENEYQYKLPPPFDQGKLPRLGYINIGLRNPLQDTVESN